MTNGLAGEETQETRCSLPPDGDVVLRGSAQLPSVHESAVMVVRERHERGVALHGADRFAASPKAFYLTVSLPFIPAAACPGTVQR